jgi:hypothetical protein
VFRPVGRGAVEVDERRGGHGVSLVAGVCHAS